MLNSFLQASKISYFIPPPHFLLYKIVSVGFSLVINNTCSLWISAFRKHEYHEYHKLLSMKKWLNPRFPKIFCEQFCLFRSLILNLLNFQANLWGKVDEAMCTDLNKFSQLIKAPADVDLAIIQTQLCALNLNGTKLLMELTDSLEGLQDVVDSVSQIYFTEHTARTIKILVCSVFCSQYIAQLLHYKPARGYFVHLFSHLLPPLKRQLNNFKKVP